jgi:hypothetical protein
MPYIHTINIKKYLTPKIPRTLLKIKEITIPLFQPHEAASKLYPIIIVYIRVPFFSSDALLLLIQFQNLAIPEFGQT